MKPGKRLYRCRWTLMHWLLAWRKGVFGKGKPFRLAVLSCLMAVGLSGQALGEAAAFSGGKPGEGGGVQDCGRTLDVSCLVSEALAWARKEKKDADHIGVFVSIAKLQAKIGAAGDAGQTIAELRTIVEQTEDEFRRDILWSMVIDAHLDMGDISGAAKTAGAIRSDWFRVWALVDIAEAELKRGGKVEALQIASDALAIASRKPHDGLILYQVLRMPRIYKDAGQLQEARRIVNDALAGVDRLTVFFPIDPFDHLAWIARGQAVVGDRAGARRTIATAVRGALKLPIGARRDALWASIVEAQIETGDLRAALDTTYRIVDGCATWLGTIARAYVKAGKPREAERIIARARFVVHSVRPDWDCDAALGNIVNAQIEAGRLAEALDSAREIREPGSRVESIVEVALAHAKARNARVARRLFEEALGVARTIVMPGARVTALSDVATGLLEMNGHRH